MSGGKYAVAGTNTQTGSSPLFRRPSFILHSPNLVAAVVPSDLAVQEMEPPPKFTGKNTIARAEALEEIRERFRSARSEGPF